MATPAPITPTIQRPFWARALGAVVWTRAMRPREKFRDTEDRHKQREQQKRPHTTLISPIHGLP